MVVIKSVLVLVLFLLQISDSRTVHHRRHYKMTKMIIKEIKEDDEYQQEEKEQKCATLPAPMLNDILGAAFNSRYMSIDLPSENDEFESNNKAGKRGTQNVPPFYVDDTYVLELSDKPAWEVHHANEMAIIDSDNVNSNKSELTINPTEQLLDASSSNNTRVPRNTRRRLDNNNQSSKRPWECEAKIKWLDLGYDYYPRYLRTVECTKHACFYGHFTCTPRSFTVKILRRRRGECVEATNKVGINGLHNDLRELWVWEERAVNFCCDCAARAN